METEQTAASMNRKQESLMLMAMCLSVIMLCLAGLGWAVMSGQLLTLDGILLSMICLAMGGIFTLMLVWQAVAAGWIKRSKKKSGDAPSGETK